MIRKIYKVELLGVNGGTCTSSYNPNYSPQTSPTNTSPGSCSPGGCTPGTCPGPATVPGKCNALDGPDPSREDWENKILGRGNNPRREDMTWAKSDSERNMILQKYDDFLRIVKNFGSDSYVESTRSVQVNGRFATTRSIIDSTSGVTLSLLDIDGDNVVDALFSPRSERR